MLEIHKDPHRVKSAWQVGTACGDAQMSPTQVQEFAVSHPLGKLLLDGASPLRSVYGTTNWAYWTAYHEARDRAYDPEEYRGA